MNRELLFHFPCGLIVDKTVSRTLVALALGALFLLQCNLEGPEPRDPAFPAKIDLGDSAAVRAILDSNNLKDVNVRRAIDPWSKGRITTLEFDSLGLDSFTFTGDFQKLDSLTTISLSNNNISKVKVPDTLKYGNNGVSVDLEHNQLTSFPLGLLKIRGLFSVLVQYNRIDTITQDLMASGFRQIYFDYNKLCSVSDSVRIWLDSVQNNWANFQNCP